MSALSEFFGFKTGVVSDTSELPDIFPLTVLARDFVYTDVMNVYSKILTDCVERTHGIPDYAVSSLWDNCLQSEATYGLVTLLAKAMTEKADLFLVYNQALGVLREATETEREQIRIDYNTQNFSDIGVYVSFKKYSRTDMVKIYSSMEYCVVSALNKQMNLSKAIQFKMSSARASVGTIDSSFARAQAKAIANALTNGRDIVCDKDDDILTATPDITTVKESIAFLDAKRSFYYSMPLSYINGEQTTGISSTGEADTKAIERGLKQYFTSILKPTIDALFDVNVTFKSHDFRTLTNGLEAIKTFELVGNEFLSMDEKKMIIQKLFDLDKTDASA